MLKFSVQSPRIVRKNVTTQIRAGNILLAMAINLKSSSYFQCYQIRPRLPYCKHFNNIIGSLRNFAQIWAWPFRIFAMAGKYFALICLVTCLWTISGEISGSNCTTCRATRVPFQEPKSPLI